MAHFARKWEQGHIVGDMSLCSGCRTCETICSLSHEGVVNPSYSRIRIERDFLFGNLCTMDVCRQCNSAPCIEACPTGALAADELTGAKVIDDALCNGCGLCARACIMDRKVIYRHPQEKRCIKCDLCSGEPKCVSACPMGALSYEEVAR